jgi:hypothetical protein
MGSTADCKNSKSPAKSAVEKAVESDVALLLIAILPRLRNYWSTV